MTMAGSATPELTDDDLRQRVSVLEEGIVVWDEVSHPTERAAEVMGDELARLVAPIGDYGLLIDLTGAGRPTASVRAMLRAHFGRVPAAHAAAFTGQNMLLNAMAYFVLGGVGHASYSVHRGRSEALDAIRRVRG
ncbi:MAG: hypothetical protein AAF602_08785 [Myxococcota bacterium]